MYKYYSGIGSRDTPSNILSIMEEAAYRLARMNWVLRSGKAPGADAAFQRGLQKYVVDSGCSNWQALGQIYIPWDKFSTDGLKEWWDNSLTSIDTILPGQVDKRYEIMKEIHPAAEYMRDHRQGAFKLHSRNVHQVLGMDIDNPKPSSFVIYYTKEDRNGNPKGGTATAVHLAQKFGVRTLNLLHEENIVKLDIFLNAMEEKRGLSTGVSK